MRYDDRLATVLNQPANDRHDLAVRWRQLVDLIARAGPNGANPMVARAITEIREERPLVDENLRAAAARAVAALPLPLGLLELFASDRLTVAAPVLAAASLDASQWRALFAVADPETRRFIETLHPESGSEPAIAAVRDAALEVTEPYVERIFPEPPEPPLSVPSLHDVVERIERRQRERRAQPGASSDDPSAAPLAGSSALFRWECGPSGEIAWVDGAARGALIGRTIARPEDGEGNRLDDQLVRAFSLRAPFRDAVLSIAGDGPVSGDWRISGLPAFAPADGRFAGYRGIALRDSPAAALHQAASDMLADPYSLRELVHEIKTPLNAIIGFAEIIDHQYLGPADHRYRERANEIVTQARLLLTAIDDLDFAARTHGEATGNALLTNLGQLVERIGPALREQAGARGVELEASRAIGGVTAKIGPELAERLIQRMANAIIEQAGEGETLRLSVDSFAGQCLVSLTRPSALQGQPDGRLFGTQRGLEAGEVSLRLVRGLARIAGADLVSSSETVSLAFNRS